MRLLIYIVSVILIGLAAVTATPTFASEITVSQSVNRVEMAFEDTVTLTVTLNWDGQPQRFIFPRPFSVNSDKLKTASYSSHIKSTNPGGATSTTKVFEYKLVPTLSGTALIEPVVIDYVQPADSVAGQVSTEALSVTVAQPKPRPKDGESNGGWSAWWFLLLIVPIGVVAWLLLGRKKADSQPELTPLDQFLLQLRQLRVDSRDDLRAFQSGLLKIIYEFLQAKYHLDLSGKKAGEVVEMLSQTGMSTGRQERLAEWITRAERDKYSPLPDQPGETMRLEAEIRAFFENMTKTE